MEVRRKKLTKSTPPTDQALAVLTNLNFFTHHRHRTMNRKIEQIIGQLTDFP